jgi:hypothetical protein
MRRTTSCGVLALLGDAKYWNAMRHSARPVAAVAVCLWCDLEFSPRNSGGFPQRFCCPEHRRAFHIAAHQFVLEEFSAGRVTVAAIKKFAAANRVSAEEHVSPSVPFAAPEQSGRRDDHSGRQPKGPFQPEHAFVPE